MLAFFGGSVGLPERFVPAFLAESVAFRRHGEALRAAKNEHLLSIGISGDTSMLKSGFKMNGWHFGARHRSARHLASGLPPAGLSRFFDPIQAFH
jgi:hypothetical protein